jgi:hypothetical protein
MDIGRLTAHGHSRPSEPVDAIVVLPQGIRVGRRVVEVLLDVRLQCSRQISLRTAIQTVVALNSDRTGWDSLNGPARMLLISV